LRPPRPNPAVILAGLDENQAWGAPNFQPAPQLYAQKSAFFDLFLQIDVPVRRILYSLPTFGSNKHQFGESHTVKQNKQIN
jgi:hypothetical protein